MLCFSLVQVDTPCKVYLCCHGLSKAYVKCIICSSWFMFRMFLFAVLKPGFIVLFCVSLSHLLLFVYQSGSIVVFLSFIPVFVFCIYLTWFNSGCIYLSRVKPGCMFCLDLIQIVFTCLDLRHVVFIQFDLIHIVFVCLDLSKNIFMCLDLVHSVCICPDSCQVVFFILM